MARLNLVIADTDEGYLESLADFISHNYSYRFQTSIFTNRDSLSRYLSAGNNVDILLVGPEIYSDGIQHNTITTVILLSSGTLSFDSAGLRTVNRYQRGDMLVSEITGIFSEYGKNIVFTGNSAKKTKVVAVYSPVGGSGKTSIAVNCSTYCAQRGLSVFYLDLESVHSSPALFENTREQNLSNIFFHLKEKNKNLEIKLESIRCRDSEHGIYYFLPPDSVLEMDEMEPAELGELVNRLRLSGSYDIIFIDMSSSFDRKNLAVMEASDEILLVTVPDVFSEKRINCLMREFDIISQKRNLTLPEKVRIVLNKYGNGAYQSLDNALSSLGKQIIKIPLIEELINPEDSRNHTSPAGRLGSEIGVLAEELIATGGLQV